MRVCLRCCAALVLLTAVLAGVVGAEEDEEAAFHGDPGIVARYTSLAANAGHRFVERVQAVPRLYGGNDETPDPRLPAGPFSARYVGRLLVPYQDKYVFTVAQSSLSELRMSLEGRPVVLGEPVELPQGAALLVIEGKHVQGVPAFQLCWRSSSFGDEPIDARFFQHEQQLSIDAEKQALADRGAVLADNMGCFRCHAAPKGWSETLSSQLSPPERLPGPRLGVGRYQRGWLQRWLVNPSATSPDGARMPALLDDDGLSAPIIAAWLGGESSEPKEDAQAAGDLEQGNQIFQVSGCAACHAPPGVEAGINPALVSRVPALTALKRKWHPAALIDFLLHPLESRPHGRMPDFNLSPTQARDLAAYLLSLTGGPTIPDPGGPSLAAIAIEWKRFRKDAPPDARTLETVALTEMAKRRCFNCHDVNAASQLEIERPATGDAIVKLNHMLITPDGPAAVPPLADLSAEHARQGCLAMEGQAPRFSIDPEDRRALIALVSQLSTAGSKSTMERTRIDLVELNCLRCHTNEGVGGKVLAALSGDDEAARFSQPPMLTAVGARLRMNRLSDWLTRGARDEAMRPGLSRGCLASALMGGDWPARWPRATAPRKQPRSLLSRRPRSRPRSHRPASSASICKQAAF